MNPTFFGYWSGELPAVTELHFRSFVHHHTDGRYELWLDEDGESGINSPALRWIESHHAIQVRRFSLNRLIEKYVATKSIAEYERLSILKHWGRRIQRWIAPYWHTKNAWIHPNMGTRYKHSSWLFQGFAKNKVYRGDLARYLIPLEHYSGASFYVDLDLCFLSNLITLCGAQSFTYRWENRDFANSAVLYLPSCSLVRRIVEVGNERECFDPWILCTEATCDSLGINIRAARDFDPLWDPHSLLYGSPRHFFENRIDVETDLAALKAERHFATHWHNNWKTVPARDSLYRALLEECSSRS